jgi:hypothetical protein
MWGVVGLRALRFANPFVRHALESRAHPLLSRQLLVLSYRGHRSGRRFQIPLRYARMPDEGIVVLAIRSGRKQWWRSFAPTGEATLTLRGARLAAQGSMAEGSRREGALAAYLVRYPRSARVVRDAAVVVFEPADG